MNTLLKQFSLIEDVKQNAEGLDVDVLIEALSVTEFSAPVNAITLLQQLKEAKYQVKVGQEFDIKSVNVVQFRRCKLFDQTLATHENVSAKLQEFIAFKTNDPMARFGKKDQHFTNGGILVQTGLIHAHLTGDISILYKRSGKNPIIIDLVAVLTHDELGTGQPPNIKQQKKMVKILSNQTFESERPKVVAIIVEGQRIPITEFFDEKDSFGGGKPPVKPPKKRRGPWDDDDEQEENKFLPHMEEFCKTHGELRFDYWPDSAEFEIYAGTQTVEKILRDLKTYVRFAADRISGRVVITKNNIQHGFIVGDFDVEVNKFRD